MAPSARPGRGLDGLLAGLGLLGAHPSISDGLVQFHVLAASGSYAGQHVSSGIGLDEVSSWPIIPPHWVHLPEDVRLSATNAQPSSKPGWLRHSRNIVGWGGCGDPVQVWLAHVRSVLRGTT